MPIWNVNYKSVPQSFKNPGEGAWHFRDFKEAVEDRGDLEHIWGPDETGLAQGTVPGGTHREGAARITVADEGTVGRGNDERTASASGRIGQIVADMEILDMRRQQDGVDIDIVDGGLTTGAQLTKKLSVVTATLDVNGLPIDASDPTVNAVYDLFDYDRMVDIHQDQDVNGIKRFTLNPQVPNVAAAGSGSVEEGWKDYLDAPPATDGNGLAAVNVSEAFEVFAGAKAFNIFDPTDPDNFDERVVDNDAPNGVGFRMPYDIYATTIYGYKVYGAVYG